MKLQAGKTYSRRDGVIEDIVKTNTLLAFNAFGDSWFLDGDWNRYSTDANDLISEVPSSGHAFSETEEAGLSVVKQAMSDTPETDEQINGKPCTRFAIVAGDSLRDAMVKAEFARKLERERNEAREVASAWRENWRNGASMSLIASSKLPWENAERIHGGAGLPKQPETPTPLDGASC